MPSSIIVVPVEKIMPNKVIVADGWAWKFNDAGELLAHYLQEHSVCGVGLATPVPNNDSEQWVNVDKTCDPDDASHGVIARLSR